MKSRTCFYKIDIQILWLLWSCHSSLCHNPPWTEDSDGRIATINSYIDCDYCCGSIALWTAAILFSNFPTRGGSAQRRLIRHIAYRAAFYKMWSDQYIDYSPLSPGVPDRYHLRPDLGGHPSALQQQQYQHADFNPQQVWIYCKYCTCEIPRRKCVYSYSKYVRFKCGESFILSTTTTVVLHFYSVNISFENIIFFSLLGRGP